MENTDFIISGNDQYPEKILILNKTDDYEQFKTLLKERIAVRNLNRSCSDEIYHIESKGIQPLKIIIETSPRSVEDAYLTMPEYVDKKVHDIVLATIRYNGWE